MTDKKSILNSAGSAGLVLGGISIAYLLLGWVINLTGIHGILGGLLSGILWLAKFIVCIWLMNYFMKKYYASNPGCTHGELFKFGFYVAVCSAVLYSAGYLAYSLFLAPEMISEAMDQVMESYSSMLDSNSMESISNMMDKMPQISFFTNLIYCTLFGTILSAIFSAKIAPSNPFEEGGDKPADEQ